MYSEFTTRKFCASSNNIFVPVSNPQKSEISSSIWQTQQFAASAIKQQDNVIDSEEELLEFFGVDKTGELPKNTNPFVASIFDSYQTRSCSLEEALAEANMYKEQTEQVEEYSKDPEFGALCRRYYMNCSEQTPSEMLYTSRSFEELEEVHSLLVQKKQMETELAAVKDFLYTNGIKIPDEWDDILKIIPKGTEDLDDIYTFTPWQMQETLNDINNLKNTTLTNFGCADYNVVKDENGNILSISMTMPDSKGSLITSVVQYATDGQTPIEKVETILKAGQDPETRTTKYSPDGSSVTTCNCDSATPSTSAQNTALNLSGRIQNSGSTNADEFLNEDGSIKLTSDIARAYDLKDVFDILKIAANGDQKAARTMFNTILSSDEVKKVLGSSSICINENNEFVVNGEVSWLIPSNPLRCKENLAISTLFDFNNGQYVISENILNALSEDSKIRDDLGNLLSVNEYFSDANGNIITRKIENHYENNELISTTTTTYDPATSEVKTIETNSFVGKNGDLEIKTVKTDAKGNIISEKIQTPDKFSQIQNLEAIARRYTTREDLSEDELYQILTVDSLAKNNDAAIEMLFNQLAKDGIITQGYDFLKQIAGSDCNKKSIAQALLSNRENLAGLIGAINNPDADFKETYKETYGVEYNQDKIDKARLLEAQIQIYSQSQAQNLNIENLLQTQYDNNDTQGILNTMIAVYEDEEIAKQKCEEYLKEKEFLQDIAYTTPAYWNEGFAQQAFIDFYGDENLAKIKYEQAQESIDFNNSTLKGVNSVVYDDLTNRLNSNLKELGMNPETMAQDYINASKEAFGENSCLDITKLVSDYADDQNGAIKKVSGFLKGAGTVLIVGGTVIAIVSTGGVAASAAPVMLSAGKTLSMASIFGEDAANLINVATSKNASPEEIGDILKYTAKDITLHYSGRFIGKVSNGVCAGVAKWLANKGYDDAVSKVGSKAATQILVNTPLTWASKYAITGDLEISLGGEAYRNTLAIMTGIAKEKISFYTKEQQP